MEKHIVQVLGGFPGGLVIKIHLPMQEAWVRFLGREDPLEEGMVTSSSILAWDNFIDRGDWQAAVHGDTESDMT